MGKIKDGELFDKRIKLSEIATVMTFSKYQLHLIKHPELETNYKLFIPNKISLDTITCIVAKEGEASFVVLADEMKLRYISFFLNSTWGKLFLISENKFKKQIGTTNSVLIKNTEFVLHKEMESSCILIEALSQYLHIYIANNPEYGDRYSATISRFLSQVRDAMVMELFIPDVFKSYHISVLAPWKKEIEKIVDESKQEEVITKIFDSLVSSGNELMENMNKMRLFMKELTNNLMIHRKDRQ